MIYDIGITKKPFVLTKVRLNKLGLYGFEESSIFFIIKTIMPGQN